MAIVREPCVLGLPRAVCARRKLEMSRRRVKELEDQTARHGTEMEQLRTQTVAAKQVRRA